MSTSWFLDDLIRFCSLSALLRGVVRYHFVYFLEPWLALLHSSIFFRLLSPAWPAFSCSRPSSFMFCFSKCYINSAMTSLSSSVQDSQIFSAWWFNQRSLPVGSSAHVSPVRLELPGTTGGPGYEVWRAHYWQEWFKRYLWLLANQMKNVWISRKNVWNSRR